MMILRHLIIQVLILCFSVGLSAQNNTVSEITPEDIRSHISFLASDDLMGRFPGTPGIDTAAAYIRNQFLSSGLELPGNSGYQEFELVVSVQAGDNNHFRVGDYNGTFSLDFAPFPFSKNATLEAPVVFAGYGFDILLDSLVWNDYENLDVTGKWVIILRGDPELDKAESPYSSFGEDRDKVLTARDKGAGGVIFVSGKKYDARDELIALYFDKTQSNAGVPVLHISRAMADRILAIDHKSIGALDSLIISTMQPHSFLLTTVASGSVEILQEHVVAKNVVGLLEGSDPALKSTYVVVGAHYDHLGMGGTGSGSRFLDSMAIHNGADDNASGVAGVLELAAKLSAERSSLKRSVLFIAFDAEEQGLIGSKYFVNNPLVDLKSIIAMINFDMIGRLKEENPAIMIGGMGTSKESADIVESIDHGPVQINFSPDGYGPSDHAAFYGEDIPVFFISTGAHEDYHTPDDDWQRINYEGQKLVLDIAEQLVMNLANREEYLTFAEAGPKKQSDNTGYRFKVTLGIMPDFTAVTDGGLAVGGVKKDGPAYRGGMLKGDVIKAMDGKTVNDIYDYMNRLQKLKAGQVLSVDVLRGDQTVVLIIQL